MTSRPNAETIELKRVDKMLLTRDRGERVRTKAEKALAAGHDVVFDFAEVDVVTPSFADEVFGDLAVALGRERLRARIRVVHASKEVRHLLAVVVANRLRENGSPSAAESTRTR
jgi:hypothetical protein